MAEGDNPQGAPAPVTPPAGPAPDQEDKEWGQATEEFTKSKDFNPANSKKEEGNKPDEPAKPKDESKDGKPDSDKSAADKPSTDPDGGGEDDKDKKPEQAPKSDDADKDKEPEEPALGDPDARTHRQRQRQLAQDEAEVKADIRKEMFSDVQTKILDADGEPIETIEDVMKHTNSVTGKPFTEEEAGAWLLKAQQHVRAEQERVEKQVDSIAQTLLDLKDWSESVRSKYGEFIKANPDIWNPIWAEYERTLEKDEKSEIITKAPVNLESFVEVALAPHLKLAEQVQQQSAQEDKDKKEQKQQEQKQKQQDRSDIAGTGKTGISDPEDDEWDKAAKQHYGEKVK